MLIVGSGGLRGAYSAGVLAELCRRLGPDYFDAILASSVGVYAATFYVADQPNIIENTWRNYVDSDKLVDFANKLKKKNILNLDYLSSIFKNHISKLNVKRVIESGVNLKYVLTDFKTGNVVYLSPNETNIFDAMKASSAIFPLHSPVKIANRFYIDGGLSEPLPFRRRFADKYNKVLIVHNKEKSYTERRAIVLLFKLFSRLISSKIGFLLDNYFKNLEEIKKEAIKHNNVFLLEPSKKIPLKSLLDTNRKRINDTVDLGIKDTERAIKFLSF